ncbi:MAG: amidohydrolase family protein [Dehalococcoidales bacterium]|jgi:predicted TIM-barrel fold metal-dependent hydrolase
MIIDFHTHILPPQVKDRRSDYAARDTAFGQIYGGGKVKIATAEDLISSMDRDGVDLSVVVNYQWSTHALCVETNDYIMEAVARYPKRLIGFGAVHSYTDEVPLKEIERFVEGGLRGVGELRPETTALDYLHKELLKPFYDLLLKYKLIVLTHSSEPVGHLYPGKGGATPGLLYAFIAGFPDIPIVCAHWGGGLPFYTLMPEVRTALENVYFDTAISPFLYRPEIYAHVTRLIGADRVLFGSDFPVIAQSRIINEIKAADLSEDARDEILAGNAARLLGLK